jgi:hypothetical protein
MLFVTLLAAIFLLVLQSTASITPNTTAPATTTVTVSPVPAPSACLSDHDARVASSNGYQPLCDIDFPDQNILPFLWVGDFEECLQQCDKFNMNDTYDHGRNGLTCKAALFAPGRFAGSDDCYLKFGLEDPRPANLTIIGGLKLPVNQSSRTSTRSLGRHSTAHSTATAHSTSTHSATVHTSMSEISTEWVSVDSTPWVAVSTGTYQVSSKHPTQNSSTWVSSTNATSAPVSTSAPRSTAESSVQSTGTAFAILTVPTTHHTHV